MNPTLKPLLIFPRLPALCHFCSCRSQGNAVFYALVMLQVWELSSDSQSAWGLEDPAVTPQSSCSVPACSWWGTTNQTLSVPLRCYGLFCSSSLATTHHLDWNTHWVSSYFSCKAAYHSLHPPVDSDKHLDSPSVAKKLWINFENIMCVYISNIQCMPPTSQVLTYLSPLERS